MWNQIPYAGSFQRGIRHRSTDPLERVWREIERVGTVDNLVRIATAKGHGKAVDRPASLKIRQAIELRRASRDASTLTKPLLLYYSMLNLTRGLLLAHTGSFGAAAHGLVYHAGASLLECKAEVSRRGTFRTFAESVGLTATDLDGKSFSLRDLFAVIPELAADFPLLRDGESSIVSVKITSYIGGYTLLRFYIPAETEAGFETNWPTLFPWMVDVCEFDSPFTLRIKEKLKHESDVANFCAKCLMHNMRLLDNAIWYDHKVGGNVALLPRIVAYIAAMFILSNVSRYEPEFLDDATLQLTDLGFFVRAFLENAERFFPQLILELLHGKPVYFE